LITRSVNHNAPSGPCVMALIEFVSIEATAFVVTLPLG